MADQLPLPPSGLGAANNTLATKRPTFAFLPLADDSPTLSTRGQRLGSVLRNQSSASLRNMRFESSTLRPRTSEIVDENDAELGRAHTRSSNDETDGSGGATVLRAGHPLSRHVTGEYSNDELDKKLKSGERALQTSQMRSQRLIGNSNPRYKWEQYYKSEEALKAMKKSTRKYYERNNFLVQQYLYIDRLLDSSLPQNLVAEYGAAGNEDSQPQNGSLDERAVQDSQLDGARKMKRTKDLFKVSNEETPLIGGKTSTDEVQADCSGPMFEFQDEAESGSRTVAIAIYLNFAANAILLVLKIIVTVLTSSLSVLASLVDSVLDFLSTFIVWTTSRLISGGKGDVENYPVGRRRLEPLGVLVFSVIMITSFVQVAIEAVNRLTSGDHEVVELSISAIVIMATTVVTKFLCWVWCRLIRNSSVQALAQDAMTDVVFNTFSIIFPLIGYYASVWWLDPLGGLLLSLYVIFNWSITTRTHILNLTGRACDADERNVLLYLTMRFAHSIKHVQDLKAYHAGDKINVEVDIVLDADMSLRDSHDLAESLQYVLESVPGVERAFVHTDYKSSNLPSHMQQ